MDHDVSKVDNTLILLDMSKYKNTTWQNWYQFVLRFDVVVVVVIVVVAKMVWLP